MSFETILTTSKEIDLSTRNEVLSCFETSKFFRITERQISKEKSACTYAYIETHRENRPEDFCIVIENLEVYLCFYSATTEQQNLITHLLAECLHAVGIQGEFEEP